MSPTQLRKPAVPMMEMLCPPLSCAMGLGTAWVERLPGETQIRVLVIRVPSNPNDIESKPRDYALALVDADAKRLAKALEGVGNAQ